MNSAYALMTRGQPPLIETSFCITWCLTTPTTRSTRASVNPEVINYVVNFSDDFFFGGASRNGHCFVLTSSVTLCTDLTWASAHTDQVLAVEPIILKACLLNDLFLYRRCSLSVTCRMRTYVYKFNVLLPMSTIIGVNWGKAATSNNSSS